MSSNNNSDNLILVFLIGGVLGGLLTAFLTPCNSEDARNHAGEIKKLSTNKLHDFLSNIINKLDNISKRFDSITKRGTDVLIEDEIL